MDFGLGIGYNTEPSNSSSQTAPAPARSATIKSVKTGVMAQFKSSFVSASSNSSQNQVSNSSFSANKRPALSGFVSGGTIGGEFKSRPSMNSPVPPPTSAQASGADLDNQKDVERLASISLPPSYS